MTDQREKVAEIIKDGIFEYNEGGWGVDDETALAMADLIIPRVAAKTPAWQRIETAPKDGVDILICSCEGVQIAWWCENYSEFLDGHEIAWAEPTHWMPLPEPPAQQAEWEAE